MNMFKKDDSKKNKNKVIRNKKGEIIGQKAPNNIVKSIYFATHFAEGEGPKKHECQDTLVVVDNHKDVFYFFAVFDGHGTCGKEASNATSDNFQQYLEKKFKKKSIQGLKTNSQKDDFMKEAFKNAESKLKLSGIDYSNSGTCCISIFIIENKVTIANLGDSRAVLCRINAKKEKLAIELSYDHKPTRKDEKKRIKSKNGKIERLNYNGELVGPYRVWADDEGPGIAMTRTLGDFQAKKIGLISVPEIQHIELKRGDQFIVIASDGLWDVMSSAEVVGFVLYHQDVWVEGENVIAEKLVSEARGRWQELNAMKKVNNKIGDYPTARKGIDDISVIIAFIQFEDGDNNSNDNLKIDEESRLNSNYK